MGGVFVDTIKRVQDLINTNFPKTARIFKYHNSLKKSEF